MRMTKKMHEALAALGPAYKTQVIDWELCIYRDLGNGFDIEVSGMDNNRRKPIYCPSVWVWDMRPGVDRTVENVRDIKSLPELVRVLDMLSDKYGGDGTLPRGHMEDADMPG